MEFVSSEFAPRGHYSSGVISGNTLYISGQTSSDPDRNGFPAEGGINSEMKIAFKKVESVLKAAGITKNHVVMCKIYITSMDYWDIADFEFKEYFKEHKPARIIVPIGMLSKGCNVELEVIAELKP